jgi:predicted nucleic acid-binding protein
VSVLVDSNVWSEALRKTSQPPSQYVVALRNLIADQQVEMIGAIRQEVLSGVREVERFTHFKAILSAFLDRQPNTAEYEKAAALYNLFRSHGVQASATDCLLCACALAWQQPILTKDQDFLLYQKYVDLWLYEI